MPDDGANNAGHLGTTTQDPTTDILGPSLPHSVESGHSLGLETPTHTSLTNVHTDTLTCTHIPVYSQTYTYIHTDILTYIRTLTFIHKHTNIYTHPLMYTHTY